MVQRSSQLQLAVLLLAPFIDFQPCQRVAIMSTDRQAEEGETSTPTPVPVEVVCLEDLQSTVDALVQKALEKNSPPIPAMPSGTTPGGEWNTSFCNAGYVARPPSPR